MLRKPSRYWIVAALTLCTSLVTASWGRANERATEFNISPQSLDSALLIFAKQAGVQVSVSTTAIAGMKTPGVVGKLTPSVALTQLLAETDLQFSTVGDRTYAVAQEQVVPGAQLPKASSPSTVPTTPSETAAGASAGAVEGAKKNSSTDDGDGGQPYTPLGELVVTGTNIRGKPVIGSEVITIDRERIDKSGYATVKDLLAVLPQNFGGGATEDDRSDPRGGNFNYGTGVNLRGLGTDATLVLVNGRRQAPGGTNGAFVDISSIALSAVERIEVLADGASAIYGSDAVGGVVNIILRSDFDGAETRARMGTAGGEADDKVLTQLVGKNWSTGNVVAGYQYSKRDALAKSDRPYTADDDKSRFGGDDFRTFLSNPGTVIDLNTGQTLAIPSGQDGTSLTPADLLPGINLHNTAERAEYLPEQEMHSAFLNTVQELGRGLEVFAEGRYSRRDVSINTFASSSFLFIPPSNAFFVDVFGGSPYFIAYDFLDDLGPITSRGEVRTVDAALGLSAKVGNSWQMRVNGSYTEEKNNFEATNVLDFAALDAALADSDPATAFNPYADGSNTNPSTLAAIRGLQLERGVADVLCFDLIADGPLFQLPGGSATLAAGAAYREEDLLTEFSLFGGGTLRTPSTRDVSALFMEFALPLISKENARAGLQGLEISLAGRYEDYSDFGTSFNPKAAINWLPVTSVRVRGTWGKSFKAPRLQDLVEAAPGNVVVVTPVPDPQSPTGDSFVLLQAGGNAGLQEETATTWGAGVDFQPQSNLSMSLSYFDIDYEGRIEQGGPRDPFLILFQEEQWMSIINRNPSQAEVEALCNSPFLSGTTPADCLAGQYDATLDLRLRNLAKLRLRGIDADYRQSFETARGVIGWELSGAYLLSYERAVSDTSPLFEIADTVNNPVDLRLRGALSWNQGGFGVDTHVNYMGGYRDDLSVPNRSVESWTTVDLQVSYRTVQREQWYSGAELALSAVNVFDEPPPFVNNIFGYDTTNGDLLGRVVSLQLTKKW